MKVLKIGVLISSLVLFTLSGISCGKSEEKGKVKYLNFKPEVADVWEEVAQLYTEKTGIEVEIVNSPSNSNDQTLQSELAKREAPTLFQINGPVGFANWKYYCEDLSDTNLYSWVIDKDMVIKGEDGGVYGIPYVVEGYGIIYNDAIMQKYFSINNKATTFKSVDEIDNYEKLKAVVEDMTAHKEELGIKGVFASTSFAAGEDWRWQTHLMNIPVFYEYKEKGVDDLDNLDFSYGENYKNIFDLYLDNSVVDKKDVASKTVSDSMSEFARGECAMVQNGNWGWTQIVSTEGNIISEEDCKFLPIYSGVEGEENQGICTGTESYICVNCDASEADKKASIDFLEWLFSSEEGKDYVQNKFEFITVFDTFSEDEVPKNPLAKEVVSYMNDSTKYSVSWNFTTFPSQNFKDKLSDKLYSYIIGESNFDTVKEYVVYEWQLEKKQ